MDNDLILLYDFVAVDGVSGVATGNFWKIFIDTDGNIFENFYKDNTSEGKLICIWYPHDIVSFIKYMEDWEDWDDGTFVKTYKRF